ncbi:MAG: diguanylate cyclase [Desulfarculus sp.]|nr:diguanylate cyclase [Desulfarculus sp.]
MSPRALTATYLSALGLIALMIVAGNAVATAYLERQERDARTINLAGRQRMLYLSISREALLLIRGGELAQRRQAAQKLGKALEEWERVHQALDQGDPELGLAPLDSPELRQQWERLRQTQSAIADSSHELLKADQRVRQAEAERLTQIILAQGERYLPQMDKLVFLYDEESRRRVTTLRRVEMALDGLTLLALVVVGLAVFRPMVRRIGQNLDRLTATAAMFQDLSFIDGLTGLANRRALDLHLEQEWRRLARSQGSLSLVMLDVDHFKRYNDFMGHLAGDDALRALARVLEGAARRPGDLAARFGGEEMVLVLTGTGLEDARLVAEQVRRQVEALGLERPDPDGCCRLTVSLGVASLVPGREVEPQRLIQAADQALYQAKAQGRNQVQTAAAA